MTNREDGPALQKLFQKLDGPAVRPAPTPQAFTAQVGAGKREPAPAAIEENELALATSGDPVEGEQQQQEDPGPTPYDYGHALHQSGEAAIQIVKNMVDAEAAGGNLRNIPEPILGWYVLTMTAQLCVLELCRAPRPERQAHAEQLQFARNVFDRFDDPYAQAVKGDIASMLEERVTLADEDRSYQGKLK